jgi:branched-subunit amino acid aminotransferase/4-amino-4-deoxychorismate lyase
VSDLLFLDSRLVPLNKARFSPLNTALFFGECLLETIPVYQGNPLFLNDHLERLGRGCRFLGWPMVPRERFEKAIQLYTVQPNTPRHFAIRFSLAQEIDPPAHPRHFSVKSPRLLGMIRPLRHHPGNFEPLQGRVGISRWRVPGPKTVPGQFKWIFYMMIRRDFRRHPEWDEMLRLDEKGFVVDGGSSSPLWFAHRKVWAPPLAGGGLESVTRNKILGLCRKLKIKVVEKRWKPSDAMKRGELFFVGSGIGVMGATHLQGWGLGRPRPLTLRLWQHYRNWTGKGASF